jgi:electron transport complex protein RnfD
MRYKLSIAPFSHSDNSVAMVMRRVIYAFIPGVMVYIWFFGWGLAVNILLGTITALSCEAVMLWLRKRPLRPFLTDWSVVITGWSLALAIPPITPWWIVVIGTFFAVVFVKHLYGGLGYNPFNPSMAAFVLLIVSFPIYLTNWPGASSLLESGHYPGIADSFSIAFNGHLANGLPLDAVSGAPPLDTMKTSLSQALTVEHIKTQLISPGYTESLFGHMGGKGWEWVILTFLCSGLLMLYFRVITWQIPVSVLGSVLILSGLFFLIDPLRYPSPLFYLFSGATILCAFFIASDPVTAATSTTGRLIYGSGIGVLTYVIRTWGGYPDGVAFAVLLMNMAVPAIDYYTQPRVFGYQENLKS